MRAARLLALSLGVAATLWLVGVAPAVAADPTAPTASTASNGATPAVPFLTGPVNDYAQIIPPDVEARIAAKIVAFKEKTGRQITVLTVPSLDGDAIESYSMRVAEAWKLGEKGKDNGALFVIANDDRKMRIEVGYGLEPELTDLQTGRILSELVVPAFKNGDFGGGVEKGVDGIVGALSGTELPAPSKVAAEPMPIGAKFLFLGIFALVVGTFSLVAIASRGAQSWVLYVFLMPFYLFFPMIVGVAAGVGAWLLWTIAFPILHLFAVRRGFGQNLLGAVANAGAAWGRRGGSGWTFGGRGGGGDWGGGGRGGGGGVGAGAAAAAASAAAGPRAVGDGVRGSPRFEAARLRGRDEGYTAYHAPRYSVLLSLLERYGVGPGTPVLDIGPSRLTSWIREHFAAPVDSLGFGEDGAGPAGRHFAFDLNRAQRVEEWRRDLPRYRVVVMAEVLEHLYTAPQLVLGFVRTLIEDEGLLILQTPNAASLPKRVKLLLGRNPYEKIRLDATNPGHYREYTVRELRALASEVGFTVEESLTDFYFDARFAHRESGEAAARRTFVGGLKNLLYRSFPASWREGQTQVWRRVAANRKP
jgi:uncharacterized protein